MYICNRKEVRTPSDKLDGLGSHKKNPLFILMMDKINDFPDENQLFDKKLQGIGCAL